MRQYKRWLLSEHNSYKVHYLPYISALLKSLSTGSSLVFSIDDSTAGQGCMVLMLSVIYKQRAIPVIWTVVKAKKGHLPEATHRELLSHLAEMVRRAIVPADCRITIVGDGEYDGCQWQSDILAYGWDYVLRTGAGRLVGEATDELMPIGSMAPAPGKSIFMLYDMHYTHQGYGPVNVMVWHKSAYKEPIYLLTNLDYPPLIQQLYKKRFKIETFFSDQKSRGFNIQRSKLAHPARLAKLLIATCLAYIFCILAGVQCLQSRFYAFVHRKDRCDLSLFSLGKRFIKLLVDLRQWRAFSLILNPV